MQLDRISSYFKEKERKRLDSLSKQTKDGLPEMSTDEIKLSCLENDGYETPELNDKLYLHFRGFKRIENLDQYTGCRAIWLDSNGFTTIENLDKLSEMRCLYISKNLISSIQNLNSLQQLNILDLSYNRLTVIENLSCCPNLQTLNVSHNQIALPSSVSHLNDCKSLTSLDITNNRLTDDEEFFVTFQKIPVLVSLSVNGNDLTRHAHFRKRMISSLPKLGYLDRPIDEQERICAVAFVQGGAEAETTARSQYRDAQIQKRKDEMDMFKTWQQEHRQAKMAARAAATVNGVIVTKNGSEISSLSDEMLQQEKEAAKTERLRLAAIEGQKEKQLLALGVDVLAKTYWQLDSTSSSSSDTKNEQGRRDIYEEAVQQVMADAEAVKNNNQSKNDKEGADMIISNRVTELQDIDVDDVDLTIVSDDNLAITSARVVVDESGISEKGKIEVTELMERMDDFTVTTKNDTVTTNIDSQGVINNEELKLLDMSSALLQAIAITDNHANNNNNDDNTNHMNVDTNIIQKDDNDIALISDMNIVDESLRLFKKQMLARKTENESDRDYQQKKRQQQQQQQQQQLINEKDKIDVDDKNSIISETLKDEFIKSNNSINNKQISKQSSVLWEEDDDSSAFVQLLSQNKACVWSEAVDRYLVQCVRNYSPNYEEIAQHMQNFLETEETKEIEKKMKNMTDDELKEIIKKNNTTTTTTSTVIITEDCESLHQQQRMLTSDACRVRWYQLDPQQWTGGNSNGSSSSGGLPNPLFRVFAQPIRSGTSPSTAANIGTTAANGNNHANNITDAISFDTLNRRTTATTPSYLLRPMELPSIDDDDDDEEGEENDDDTQPSDTHSNQHSENSSSTTSSSSDMSQLSVQFENTSLDVVDGLD